METAIRIHAYLRQEKVGIEIGSLKSINHGGKAQELFSQIFSLIEYFR